MERYAMRPTFGVAVIAALGAAYFSTDSARHETRPRGAERAAPERALHATASDKVVSVVLPEAPHPPALGLDRGSPRR